MRIRVGADKPCAAAAADLGLHRDNVIDLIQRYEGALVPGMTTLAPALPSALLRLGRLLGPTSLARGV
jgi:hypothetical protein